MEMSHPTKLTKVLYRVTELFPKREPLKFSLRKKAGDILADAVLVFGNNSLVLTKAERTKLLERILKNVQIIQTFFELAATQDWLRQENFLVLKREYGRIAQQARQAIFAEREAAPRAPVRESATEPVREPAKRQPPARRQPSVFADISFAGLKDRHKRIIRFVKSRGAAQVKDVKEILPEVTKRTLRRDFDFLLKKGLVERRGDKNKIEYIVK